MNVKEFSVEKWMNTYEMEAKYNLAETCVDSLSLSKLLALSDEPDEFFRSLFDKKLTYGYIDGSPYFKEGISKLYKDMAPENILAMNGGIGANFLVLYSLIKPGDHVISVWPTYQQLCSVPESFGADVSLLKLKPENNFLPDLDELKSLITDKTKLICLNNPNNPTGALIEEELLMEIIEIASSCDAYILCDEVYKGLYHNDNLTVPSIVDIYEKGISTGSMSKVFSLAGLRLGWIAAQKDIIDECCKHRDYTTISCGMLDDIIASHALKNYNKILERNLSLVKKNASILENWVENEPFINYIKPKAGSTAFLKYDLPVPSEKLCIDLLNNYGTFLVPGKCFDMEGWLRIGYACDTQVLKKGLSNLSEYINKIKKTA